MASRSVAPILILAAVLLLGACAGESRCVDAGRCTGVVTGIDGAGIGEVNNFTLKSGDETVEVFVDPDKEYGFDLGHLHEHLASSEPVIVELEERDDGRVYALTIEDA